MKKYKLIKEYPGSPKLGFINGEGSFTYGVHIVEKYPEFWEEIVEKDYEILKIRVISEKYGILKKETICNFKINEKGVSSWEIKNGIYDSFNCESKCFYEWFEIYQIKRLSDGEIFTIGDKVKDIYEETNVIINNFELNHNDININDNHAKISEINKVKQPLFTTEDGVVIFEDDEVVCFDKEDWITRNEKYKFQPFDVKDKNYLFFSTKEKAEKYILMNKKSLSPNDILKIWSKLSGHSIESLLKNSKLMHRIITSIK